MRLKKLVIGGGAILLSVGVGALITYLYIAKGIAQSVWLQQEMQLQESEQLAWQAYCTEPPGVGIWALSNYLKKLDEIYSVRPEKDKNFYYFTFVGHARLGKLYNLTLEKKLKKIHLDLAEEAMEGWSRERATNEDAVFTELAKIDALEKMGQKADSIDGNQ